MIENFLKSLFEIASLNSYRRTLWVFLGIAFVVLIVESQTQFLEFYSLNQQVDLLAKVSVESGAPKINTKVEEMQLSILQGIDGLRGKRERPVSNFVEFFMLFLKGAWVMLPFAYLGGTFAKKAVVEMHNMLPAE